ncbi:MAG: DUF5666 domain-containing protein [Candidatus Peregrinibacteria bacterium]|nr:DUF5666 domain-containing protein [Candidatus Peregrinibacteria bacterium]
MKDNKTVMIVVAVLVVGIAFFGGMKYDQSQSTGQKSVGAYGQGRGGNGMGGANANRGGGRNGASGEILSMDDKSITLKLPTGGSRIVLLSDKTQVMKSTSGSKADLKIGLNLMVNGVTNADGSVTADNIQIRPAVPAQAATSVAK